ncbi:hypothetical protein [Paenibacillus popilliae]|uniref:Transcriptional regulator n=1 Tax=Paenibacillus popilliae ATCC 14706 TaxID=1212764 RepID=M9LYR7_PAEPP|nr:hypothetical protein [Paenibacillus popilliae]GAC41309.1 transcriptional regulator [Paenibacillus popilliae ATCC 14706]
MEEKKRNAATRAKQKYNNANYDQVRVWVRKGEKGRIDAAAAKLGKSRNAFVVEAIDEKIEREGLESPSENDEQDKEPQE